MAKYTLTHVCGHEQTHALFGPGRDRDRRIAWLETTLCSACWQAERDKEHAQESARAQEENAENGLPKLTGSEKQVGWAETLRADAVTWLQSEIRDSLRFVLMADRALAERCTADLLQQGGQITEDENAALCEALCALVYEWAASHTTASWWIDHRSEYTLRESFTRDCCPRAWTLLSAIRGGEDPITADQRRQEEEQRRQAEQEALRKAALVEATLRAENPSSPLIAEFTIRENEIQIAYPEFSDRLREIARMLGFRWDRRCWQIQTHSVANLAVEAACRLLAAGIHVRLHDPELRRRVTSGEWKPAPTRVVATASRSDGRDFFSLRWKRYEDTGFYAEACRLPGAYWARPHLLVPAEAYAEILDFAAAHHFTLTEKAQALVERQRGLLDEILTVAVALPPDTPPELIRAKPRRMDVPETVEIAPDLLDEEAPVC